MSTFLLLLVAIACEVAATTSLKASESFTRVGPSAIVVVGYGAAFYLLSVVLRGMPVGTAYAIWSGLGTAGAAVAGKVLFGEALGGWRIAGIVVVVAGVALIQLAPGSGSSGSGS